MRVLLVSVFVLPLVLVASQGPAVVTEGGGNATSFLFLFLYSPEEKGTKTKSVKTDGGLNRGFSMEGFKRVQMTARLDSWLRSFLKLNETKLRTGPHRPPHFELFPPLG